MSNEDIAYEKQRVRGTFFLHFLFESENNGFSKFTHYSSYKVQSNCTLGRFSKLRNENPTRKELDEVI